MCGFNLRLHWKLVDLRSVEEGGMPGVAVKCVDIWRNSGGESGSLACN